MILGDPISLFSNLLFEIDITRILLYIFNMVNRQTVFNP